MQCPGFQIITVWNCETFSTVHHSGVCPAWWVLGIQRLNKTGAVVIKVTSKVNITGVFVANV
jgi:hypothetical protein